MITVTVYGTPGPQGSKRFVGLSKRGRGILIESSPKVKDWREAVKWAFLAAGKPHVAGPVVVHAVFSLARPKKPKFPYPATKPDLDKLQRATGDALTDVGAIEEDSRIIGWNTRKVFAGTAEGLSSPGAVIRIYPLEAVS